MKLPENEASATAMDTPSDEALRVPCFCEENVWRLAYKKLYQQQKGSEGIGIRYYVVFVSSEEKLVPMLYQKASQTVNNSAFNEPVFWDYHVVLLAIKETEAFIFDLDTTLIPCPAPLDFYLDNSFSPEDYTEAVEPRFRVIEASVFLTHFSSDREHMRVDGKWTATPPTYPCIHADAANQTSNLDSFRIMTASDLKAAQSVTDKFGKVMTLDQLRAFASSGSSKSSSDCSLSLCFG